MATIGKIRERSGIVIILIGLAMLGFIATDLLSTRTGLFSRNRGPQGIGRIYNEEVDPATFQAKYERAINNQRQQLGNNEELTPFMEGQVSEQIWNQMVTDRILAKEASDLGLEVSGEEIMDLVVGPNPHPIAQQFLMDRQNNKYDVKQIYQFITTIDQNQNPQAQEFWREFEDYLSEQRMMEKFNGLVKNGVFSTDLEATAMFENDNKTVSFQYVPLFLNAIEDKDVNLSDADYKSYYDAHKEEFKRSEGRTLQYVAFDVSPTQQDTLSAEQWVSKQIEAFRKTNNDSSFVTRVGRGQYSNQYQPRGTYPAIIENAVFSADTNTVIGPFKDNGEYYLAKVISKKHDSDYMYHVSHILIRPSGATEADSAEAEKRANDVLKEIQGGADFAKVAAERSQDQSNAQKGGDLGWFRAGTMVKRFGDAVKRHTTKGDLFVVRTEFGTHIVKVLDAPSNELVKAAVLVRPVAAGKETEERAYTMASKFRSQVTNQASFDEVSKKMGLTKRIAENLSPNERQIAGLENPRELVRWAYNEDTKVGDLTDPRRVGSKYVVAILTNKTDEGYASMEDVKTQIQPMVLQEKKKEMLADRLSKAQSGSNNLEAIAKAVQSNVNTAEGVMFNRPTAGNLSNEPKLVGYAFGMKKGSISEPVKGESGVYVIKVNEVNEIKPPQSLAEQRNMMEGSQKGNAGNAAMEALRDKADVKDFRYLYY